MSLVISPEPSEEERAAIMLALRSLDGTGQETAWWRSGIDEAHGADGQEEGA